MKAVCPNRCKLQRFITVVHVTEDWIVDSDGTFQEVHPNSETYIVAEPNIGNTWQCLECNEEANFTRMIFLPPEYILSDKDRADYLFNEIECISRVFADGEMKEMS